MPDSRSWDLSVRGPEGQILWASIPLALSLWEAFRPTPRLRPMPWPTRPMTLSQARARIAQLAASQQQRVQEALRDQVRAMAQRGMYGQASGDAVLADAMGRLEGQMAAQQRAAALGLYQSDLTRYLDQLRTVADYMINRAKLDEARRQTRIWALLNALQSGLDLYRQAAEFAGRYPFTNALVPEASLEAVDWWEKINRNR